MRIFQIGLAFLVSFYLAACSTTKLEDKTTDVIPLTVGSQSSKYDPISDPKSPLYQKGSIYFDFDEYKRIVRIGVRAQDNIKEWDTPNLFR